MSADQAEYLATIMWAKVTVERNLLLGGREGALHFALKGDWEPLARYIKDGGRITPEVRAFLVDVLNGTRKRPAKKISRIEAKARDYRFSGLLRKPANAERRTSRQRPKPNSGDFRRNLQKNLAKVRHDAPKSWAVLRRMAVMVEVADIFSNPPPEWGPPPKLLVWNRGVTRVLD